MESGSHGLRSDIIKLLDEHNVKFSFVCPMAISRLAGYAPKVVGTALIVLVLPDTIQEPEAKEVVDRLVNVFHR